MVEVFKIDYMNVREVEGERKERKKGRDRSKRVKSRGVWTSKVTCSIRRNKCIKKYTKAK